MKTGVWSRLGRGATLALALGLALGMAATAARAAPRQAYFYDADGRLIGAADATSDTAGAFRVYIYDRSGDITYRGGYGNTLAQTDRIGSGEFLVPGMQLVSPDGRFRLTFQSDGNVVLYFGASPLWASQTNTGAAIWFYMQTNGNLVLYAPGPPQPVGTTPVSFIISFQTMSFIAGSYARLQNDGNFVVYNTSGGVVWQTGTGGH